jgi:hypothetical protein
MIKAECKLKLSDVAAVRTIRALVAEFDYLQAQGKIGDLSPERVVKLNDVTVYLAHSIVDWCAGTVCANGKSFALDGGDGTYLKVLDLPDVTIAEIARRMVGLVDDEAKKSGAPSLPPFEVRPAQ